MIFQTVTHRREGFAVDLLSCTPLLRRSVPHGFSFRCRSESSGVVFGARAESEADRRDVAAAMDVDAFAYMKQVHGNRVLAAERAGEVGECDGIVSTEAALGLLVHTADCVPVLMWDERSNRVAACHAGWRGTRSRVAAHTALRLAEDGGSETRFIHAVFGPAIRACCFEVGDEVVRAFAEARFDSPGLVRRNDRPRAHLDLGIANTQQLVEAGIPENHIYDSGRCTRCENESFYSYRAEGPGVGRVMSVIAPPNRG